MTRKIVMDDPTLDIRTFEAVIEKLKEAGWDNLGDIEALRGHGDPVQWLEAEMTHAEEGPTDDELRRALSITTFGHSGAHIPQSMIDQWRRDMKKISEPYNPITNPDGVRHEPTNQSS